MNSVTRLAAAATASLLALTACGSPSPAEGDGPTIVTAFYPLQWATEAVLGDTPATVDTLTTPGAEAHDLELTPQQIASLGTADLVVYMTEFQPAVDKAIEQSGAAAVLDAATAVDLLPADEEGHSHEGGEHADETDDHAGETDEEHAAHDHGNYDPHFWQDTTRMATLVDAVAAKLSEVDAANAETYKANAAKAAEELAAIDGEYQAGLKECVRREFITTHAAFQYLGERYNMEEIGISGVNPDAEPSPARIKMVHDEAKLHGVTTIFFETLTSDAVATSIAGDLGLKTAVLDPLEGVTEKSPGTDYPSIMRANLQALMDANECR